MSRGSLATLLPASFSANRSVPRSCRVTLSKVLFTGAHLHVLVTGIFC